MENLVKNFYKNKRVLVTGATGFKGAWLCYWLIMLGAKVYGTGYNPNKNKNLFYSLKLNSKIKLKLFDIRDKEKLKSFIKFSKPQIIFHLAAQPLILESYKKPFLTYTVNSIGTLNILETVRETNSVKSLICITSDKCYENNYSTKGFKENDKLGGEDPYSGSKASAEIMIRSYHESFFKKKKCGIASARAGNVIGGGDWSENRLIPDAINSIMKNKTIFVRNPNFNRPWQHVLEPLYGYLMLGQKVYVNPKKYSGPWNFGTTRNTVTNVLTIVKEIVKFWGKGTIKFKTNQKYYEQTNLQLDINKSKKILKWKPKYSIVKSVKVTVDWYKTILTKKTSAEKITEKQIKEYMSESK
ncbi:CDP-glucose 4,6-dehydratase [Candidatus Pelagibacter sp.]|nr:CDP-glucose 4,6-dehydratase [Candidatus Pelagibacter sp.]